VLHYAKTVIGFGAIYLLADSALNRIGFSDGWTIIWPLNGVTIAVLLMRPRAMWPWILSGVALGTGLGEWYDKQAPVALLVCERLCSVSEVLMSAWLLPRFTSLEEWLRTPRIIVRFFAALVVGPGISGIFAAELYHVAAAQPLRVAFNDWATADAIGNAATIPIALALKSEQMRALFARGTIWRTSAVLVISVIGTALIFNVTSYPLIFLLYPMLLLVDSLLGLPGSAITAVGVCLISVYCTTNSLGYFGEWPADRYISRNVALQMYFGFHMFAVFPISVMFTEKRRITRELHVANERLTVLASLDGLTGIANRRAFDQRFDFEWNRAVRHQESLALALIDIDNFKQYNDLYGHLAGDGCLCAVAQTLAQEGQRGEDLVARYGGEEFVLLLPHTTVDGARVVAERIRAAVFDLHLAHPGSVGGELSVSVGCSAIVPAASDGKDLLVRFADAALYQAKEAGRNRVEAISSTEVAGTHGNSSARLRILKIVGRESN
jgi:diguanylate cyclase (GGDEF)-like protein